MTLQNSSKLLAEKIATFINKTANEIDAELLETIHIGIEAEANKGEGVHVYVSITKHEGELAEIVESHNTKIKRDIR